MNSDFANFAISFANFAVKNLPHLHIISYSRISKVGQAFLIVALGLVGVPALAGVLKKTA
jgi:hypothetical protein